MLNGAAEMAGKADLLVCPPAAWSAAFADKSGRQGGRGRGRRIAIPRPPGPIPAISPPKYWLSRVRPAIIVGHSERRADHGESDALVRQNAEAAWRAEVIAIVCIGEAGPARCRPDPGHPPRPARRLALPDSSTAADLVVAYEPVWAIGAGLTPRPRMSSGFAGFIRELRPPGSRTHGAGMRMPLRRLGRSPRDRPELMAVKNVNGALVGGASLKAAVFADCQGLP